MQDLNIALIQAMLSWENPERNLANFSKKLKQINNNPDLVVLPEMFNTGFTMNVNNCAEEMHGNSVQWLKEKAGELNCVLTGSLLIKEKNKYYNRLIWMRPDGSYETYDKRHLFRMGNEHKTMTGGTEKKIAELNGWKFNLQICYDLRFPAWSRNSFDNGLFEYDVLLYVANWPAIRNQAYKTLLPARAIDNQAYVIWVNRVGTDGNNINHSGDSMLVEPSGKTRDIANPEYEEILNTILSAELLQNLRSKFKVSLDWDKLTIKP